jgi:RHS repeat-associated protein
MTLKPFFCLNTYFNHVNRLIAVFSFEPVNKIFFLLPLFFIVLSLVGAARAQNPVFVKNFRFGGQVFHNVNGNYVPYPGAPILLDIESQLTLPGSPIYLVTTTTVGIRTDNDGRYEYILPCYSDASGQWSSYYTAKAQIIGGTGSIGPGGGGMGCSWEELGQFLNHSFIASSDSSEEDRQNAGRGCAEGRPVSVTNGNMWLEQNDYNLPGVGENIKIHRFYNSLRQRSGMFGFGWSSDYDEAIPNYNNTDYVTLDTGTGRGFYFANIGNNVFQSASVDFYGQIVKNSDNTFTLTFKDGRVHKFSSVGKLLWQKDRNGNQTTLSYNQNGHLTGVTEAFGRTLTITPYDSSSPHYGLVHYISDSLGTIATYDYDPNNPSWLKTVTYNDGSKYQFEYDTTSASGKTLLKTVKDALGNILETHDYDGSGRATTSGIAANGAIEKYTFDYTNWGGTNPYTSVTYVKNTGDTAVETKYYFDKSKGRDVVTKIEGSCGCGNGSEVTTFEYDERINLKKRTDALNRQQIYIYDPTNGNPLSVTDKAVNANSQIVDLGTVNLTYNQFGQVLTITDKMSGMWTFTYDAAGNLKTLKNPLDYVTTIEYPTVNNKGLPESIKDARNNVTKFQWFPASGLLQEIEDPYQKKVSYTYDARGRTKTVTRNTPAEITTYNYFDDTQRKVELIYPNQDRITYKYDVRRLLESVTDERGKITTFEFDAAYRLTKVTDPLGHDKEFGYDLMSNLKWTKDGLDQQTDYKYDNFNRLQEIEYPPAQSGATRLKETFVYDTVGRIKKHYDTANRLTEYGYDDANRKRTITNAELEPTEFTYNARNQLIEVKDANNQIYTFTSDPLNRLLTQTRAGVTMSYQYDEVGNRQKRTDYLGRVTKYKHDKLNRLEEIEYALSTDYNVSPLESVKSIYTYDELSRLKTATNEAGTVSFNYDKRSRIEKTIDVFGHTLVYEYERTPTVNQTRLKFDAAPYAVYNYDDANRPANIVNSADNAQINFGFDEADRLTSRTYPNGITTTYDYDGMSRLKRLKDATSTATLFDRQYQYNTANQIYQIAEPTLTRTFGYDLVDRLKTNTASNNQNESYNYDDVGNRSSSHRSATYSYQSFNKLTSTATANYNYDANGNMTTKAEGSNFWRYTWDYENRLSFASNRRQTVRYIYDALGRRVRRYTKAGENTKLIYDGSDALIDDNDGTLTKYLNGAGIDNKLRQTTGSTASYFLTDHLGSTNGLADSSGNLTASTSYDSFGNATNQSFPTRYQFTGREFDATTGLHHYRARQYDANLGRFISEDPIGFAGGDINLFGYVKNKPLKYRDPSGLDDADREWEDRLKPPIPIPNPWYWSHNEAADNPEPELSASVPLSNEELERVRACYQKNKFSALFSDIPYGQGTIEVLETGSAISIGSDVVATVVKASGKTFGKPQPYASGINWTLRRTSDALGNPLVGGKPLKGTLTGAGNYATRSFLVFGVFTFTYNTTVDIQCICGVLK